MLANELFWLCKQRKTKQRQTCMLKNRKINVSEYTCDDNTVEYYLRFKEIDSKTDQVDLFEKRRFFFAFLSFFVRFVCHFL